MNSERLLIAAGLVAVVTGCTTAPVESNRTPVTADAHFTIPCLDV